MIGGQHKRHHVLACRLGCHHHSLALNSQPGCIVFVQCAPFAPPTQIGTPHFMAPEVWRREPYAFAADIWALGCLLHEMCTRRPLFLADGEGAIEAKVGMQGGVACTAPLVR